MKNSIFVLVVCGFGMAALSGCGIRAQIAKEKVIERIDSILGTMDVQRKEIEVSVDAFEDALLDLRKAKVKAQVKRDQIARKISLSENSISGHDNALRQMKVQLTSASDVQSNERSYSKSELSELTRRVLQQREVSAVQRTGFQQAEKCLSNVVAMLDSKQTEYQGKLLAIKHQLSIIDSNWLALKAMQDAAKTMDVTNESFSQNVAKLEEKVENLYAEVEAELLVEDVRWQKDGVLESVDQIVASMASSDDLVGEIDSIFGETE